MTFRHGKNTKVLVNTFDLSSYFNDVSFSNSVEVAETTTFGVSGGSKTYVVGLNDGTVSVNGYFDGAANAVDEVLAGVLGSATDVNFFVANDGGMTVGARCVLGQAIDTKYDVKTPVGGVVSVSTEFQCDAGADQGVVLAGLASVSTTATGTAVDNASLTSNGGVAMLHVTANTRNGTNIVKVQHSADNSTWADLVTFATVSSTTTTSERVSVASGTTVNRYLRAAYTVAGSSGSATITVGFSRRY